MLYLAQYLWGRLHGFSSAHLGSILQTFPCTSITLAFLQGHVYIQCRPEHAEVRGQCGELLTSLYHVGSCDESQAVSAGVKCLSQAPELLCQSCVLIYSNYFCLHCASRLRLRSQLCKMTVELSPWLRWSSCLRFIYF